MPVPGVAAVALCICHAGPVKARQHIRFQAEEYAQGHVLYNADQAINAAVVGVAASQGMTHLSCYKKIKITVFSSGFRKRISTFPSAFAAGVVGRGSE